MCRIKNVVKRGMQARTAHTPGHEVKKSAGERTETKGPPKEAGNIQEVLSEYHTQKTNRWDR